MKSKDQIQTEALEAIGCFRRAGVEISMGVGKTLIGLKHMAAQYTPYRKYLVTAPKKKIFQSWLDDMEKFGYGYLKEQIDFSTYISLPKQSYDYDYVYLDECHSLKATHNNWLYGYLKQGGRVLGLTGTYPTNPTSEKGKMCNFYCPRIYRYMPDEAIDDEILNDYRIIIHELTLSTKMNIPRIGPKGEFMSSEMRDYQYWNGRLDDAQTASEQQLLRIKRMKALQDMPTKEHYARLLLQAQTEKTIVFSNTKKQADNLSEHSFHSSNPESEQNLELFKAGTIDKLSAVEQLSEGVTIPGLRVGIIMHTYSNNRRAGQKIGRMLRLNPDDVATIHVLCYVDTVDKEWTNNALKAFDQSKITRIKPMFYEGLHY